MNVLGKLDKVLEKKWAEINEKWEEIEAKDGNPYELWYSFLETLGHYKTVTYESHWHPEYGVPALIKALFDVVNSDKLVYAIDFDTGSNASEVLFFDREELHEALKCV
jgi:predicted N-acyltransferase